MNDDVHIKEEGDKFIDKKGWLEFRKSGLLFLVNQFLHIFGWVIVYQYDSEIENIESSEPTNVFVAKTKYRGFGEEAQDRGYKAITKYMEDNIQQLLIDVED